MSAQQFLERLFGDLSDLIPDEDELRRTWSDPDNRERFLAVLAQRGYDAGNLAVLRAAVEPADSDLFDVLAYIRFTTPPKTRTARADRVRSEELGESSDDMRQFLLGVLKAYEAHGGTELAPARIGDMLTARFGSFSDARKRLGDVQTIRDAFVDLQRGLYRL